MVYISYWMLVILWLRAVYLQHSSNLNLIMVLQDKNKDKKEKKKEKEKEKDKKKEKKKGKKVEESEEEESKEESEEEKPKKKSGKKVRYCFRCHITSEAQNFI